jgi:excinuclease ABC subunit C
MRTLEDKISELPTVPGVYFHKDKTGEIIYIGKAANLRNRVRQYFQKSRGFDPKTDILVSEIADIDWTEVETEADALFLEAELVRRYQPRFNILLRDVNGLAVKKALRYLRRAFPYAISRPNSQKRANLYYHLGLDPGLEEGRTSLEAYRANLRKLMQYLHGNRVNLMREIEKDMKKAAKQKDFELAAKYRNQLQCLQALSRQILFSDRELQDASKDQALVDLADLLGLSKPPRRIEGFDISHMQGTDNVASMVVFVSGLPDKTSYRKFKMRLGGNDDFAHMAETIKRRLRDENVKKWGIGDLMLIDGGKGQLSVALDARDGCGKAIPMFGLAKRQEEIIIHKTRSNQQLDIAGMVEKARKAKAFVNESEDFINIELPKDTHAVKLLQRIRDESHRFAVSYHSTLKRSRQVSSILDEVPGIGPLTRKKLIKHFGSAKAAVNAETDQLQAVLGAKRGAEAARYFSQIR